MPDAARYGAGRFAGRADNVYIASIHTVFVESWYERAGVDGGRVIVGGHEQIVSATPGGAAGTMLGQLSGMSKPPFILFCLEID